MTRNDKSYERRDAEKDQILAKPRRRHSAFGCMKGIVTIAPGVDLTEPACPEWVEIIEQKYASLEAFLADTKDETELK